MIKTTILKKLQLTFFLLVAFVITSFGQLDLSFEFQAYPTGLIPGLRLEKSIGKKSAVNARVGYQFIDHRDLGVQDDETGNGYGFTLGYKYYFKEGFRGFSLGVRNDFWFNEIDWVSDVNGIEASGTSNITVVQPTAEAGYLIPIGENWIFTPTIAFGVEINVKTDGEPVGEGAILLVGLNFGYRF